VTEKNKILGLIIVFLVLILLVNFDPTAFAGFEGWNTSTASVTESTETPTVGTITVLPSPINLVGGSTLLVSCYADITDDNGVADIQSGKGNITLYDTETTTADCTTNNFNCYRNITHSGAGSLNSDICPGSGTTATCNFSIPVYYNANSSSWNCSMTITDSGGSGDTEQEIVAVNALTAIDISSSELNFGTLAPATFSDNKTEIVYNYGNIILDLQLNGTNMSCATGEDIEVGNITYNMTGPVLHGDWGTNLTGTLFSEDFNLYPNQTQSTEVPASPSNTTYWKLYLPVSSAGIRGTCSGTIWFVAQQSS